MKKQINPTIKAHLIRGAFYLLLLLAVCAIPFALAQSRSRDGRTSKAAAKTDASANKYMAQVSQRTDGAVSQQPLPKIPANGRSRTFPVTLCGFQPLRLRLHRRVPFELRRRSCQTLKEEME